MDKENIGQGNLGKERLQSGHEGSILVLTLDKFVSVSFLQKQSKLSHFFTFTEIPFPINVLMTKSLI